MLLVEHFDCCGKTEREPYEDWDAGVFVRSDDEDDEDDEEPDYGVCFTAKHTTDPTAVKYFSTRAEKKAQEKRIDYSGRNENVRTCKMTGCESNKQPKRKKLSFDAIRAVDSNEVTKLLHTGQIRMIARVAKLA
ncbi:hypothetical protein FRC09_016566 [Ceratobasidium sp. 395]|nr:hypothetical protein FRC09_016566 [Ceratobasidium sp. 395]